MLFVGVMSGTSCDGVDVVVVDIDMMAEGLAGLKVLAATTKNYPDYIKQSLLKIIANQPITISELSQLDAQLGEFYATVINLLIKDADIKYSQISAIGLHGQTVCHQPPGKDLNSANNTIQLGSAAITAQRTGITTVAHFREIDVAYGGQGAPLAPIFHQQLFRQKNEQVAILNLGGIANITVLQGDEVLGFDTGPASCLMDEYIQLHQQLPFDESGLWAKQGEIHQPLLKSLLSDAYFMLPYPKSTGRELFNINWLNQHLKHHPISHVDVQRTLLQLTVESIAVGLQQTGVLVKKMVVCGGGVHNEFLMQQLHQRFNFDVISSVELGLDPDFVEAILMAWMANQNHHQTKLDLSAITGCEVAHVYGVRYQP